MALDPLGAGHYLLLGVSQMAAGNLDAAERALRTAIDLAPGGGAFHARLARVRLMQGRLDDALAFLAQEPLEYMRLYMTALIEHAAGRPEASDRAMQALLRGYSDTCAFQIAVVHAVRGEIDAAFLWLDRAHAQRDHGLHSVREHFHLRALHADPRWPKFLARMGLADPDVQGTG